jgi:penicillin-binding protein 2
MGIGQSDLLATPLQMAAVTAAVANGGQLHTPHLVDRIEATGGTVVERPGGASRDVPVAPGHLAAVREGMRLAVTSGTARSAWSRLPDQVAIAGKTGTAEFCDPVFTESGWRCRETREGYLLTHAWFVAFAPYDNPEVALAVFVDGSGLDHIIEGSQVAAPIAADVLRAYFRLPQPTAVPTRCEDCPSTPTATPAGSE